VNDPELLPRHALADRAIGLSVSESADLSRLGLDEYHCRLVVAELSRAVMLAGGTVVYGGNLQPDGYTDILLEEARRFNGGRQVLRLCIPESEYRSVTMDRLIEIDNQLADGGALVLVSSSGTVIPIDQALDGHFGTSAVEALTAMRSHVAAVTQARLLVGGRLADFGGREPGVIEEARLTVAAGKPFFAIGGFGGASAAIARMLRPDFFDSWAPADFPAHSGDEEVRASLDSLGDECGVLSRLQDDEVLRTMMISHRPGDIASAAVRVLAQALN
jgi:hypothetical protein